MQKIKPCLWFDDRAEEAVNFYTSIFKNSKITAISRYGEVAAKASGRPQGSIMTLTFELDGQEFMALNGGPVFSFTPAISLVINCDSQDEIDRLSEELAFGGQLGQCGWLTDKFGLSWQLVPYALAQMMQDKNTQKSDQVMSALVKMNKLDVGTLQAAYEQ